MEDNFIEMAKVEDANKVDLEQYTFLERLSAVRNVYCFKKRARK